MRAFGLLSVLAISLAPIAGCRRELSEKSSAQKSSTAPKTDTNAAAKRDGNGLAAGDELQIDYAIRLDDGAEGRVVDEKFRFRSGDRFQIQLRPAFAAYLYLFNRSEGQSSCDVLLPQNGEGQRNPIASGQIATIPAPGKWLTMDSHSGLENLVMMASPVAIPDFDTPEQKIPRDECEQRLALVERDFRPSSSRIFKDKDWTKLFAARGARTAFVVRLPLDHRH